MWEVLSVLEDPGPDFGHYVPGSSHIRTPETHEPLRVADTVLLAGPLRPHRVDTGRTRVTVTGLFFLLELSMGQTKKSFVNNV